VVGQELGGGLGGFLPRMGPVRRPLSAEIERLQMLRWARVRVASLGLKCLYRAEKKKKRNETAPGDANRYVLGN